ncbi:MAG TPA: hypothetical protein VEC11_05225 [Allosphingosinicella sp.]|nr:hypothetical protein [Allosphingosinicella sp.]
MQTLRRTNRRSFLTQVAGGGLIVGAGVIFGAGDSAAQQKNQQISRQMVVDTDPSDPARPPSPPPAQPQAADRDAGPRSDPGGTGAQANTATPRERFVICPGNSRCPH